MAEAAAPCAAGLLALSLRCRPASPVPARTCSGQAHFFSAASCAPHPNPLPACWLTRCPPCLPSSYRPPPCAAEELGLPLRPTLLAFPQYLTYSLPARIAPRAAAAAALGARRLPLTQLAVGEAAWVRWLRVPPEEWWAFEEQWQGSPQAQRWTAAADT